MAVKLKGRTHMSILALLSSLRTINPVAPEQEEMPEGVLIVGELPDELKQLYTLRVRLAHDLFEQFEQLKRDYDSGMVRAVKAAITTYEIINAVFWHDIEKFFGIEGKPEIGITPDWKVWTKKKDPDNCNRPGCTMHRGGDIQLIVIEGELRL